MAALLDLPDAVLGHVLALLKPSSRGAVRLVCKHWYQTAARTPSFWEDLHVGIGFIDPHKRTRNMIRLLCRLLTAQCGLLRRVEIVTTRHAPLGCALSSLVGAALQQLCFRSIQLHPGEMKVRPASNVSGPGLYGS